MADGGQKRFSCSGGRRHRTSSINLYLSLRDRLPAWLSTSPRRKQYKMSWRSGAPTTTTTTLRQQRGRTRWTCVQWQMPVQQLSSCDLHNKSAHNYIERGEDETVSTSSPPYCISSASSSCPSTLPLGMRSLNLDGVKKER